jgi:ABC-type bacteriocin/lantibiotic exporters, contain an N-terminal double-glycine peptidase domain
MKNKSKQSVHSYSVWSNYGMAFVWMREREGGSYYFLSALFVAIAVIHPFLAMALPGAVVYLLGSGWIPERIFLVLAGYVIVLQGMLIAKGYLDGRCKKRRFLLRIHLGDQYFGAAMDADYQEFESESGQKKLQSAKMNLYYGGKKGIEAFLQAFENFFINLLGLILYSVVIGRQSLGILLLSLTVAGAAAAVHFYGHKRAVKYDEKYEKAWLDYNSLGKEIMVPAYGKDIRMYHMWNRFAVEFDKLKKDFIRWGIKWWATNTGKARTVELLLAFARDLLVYGYLIRQMMQGRMELSAFLIYIGVAAGFGNWMTPLLDAVTRALENARYVGEYRTFLDFADKKCGGEEPIDRPGQIHEIRLEHVSFRYGEGREDTIRDLSLTITPGEKIALVGMNGAGKSTLIKLICGLYRPDSGKIYLDGKDISLFSGKDYFREFAVVFQEVFAFSFSVEDNISCKEEASADKERLKLSLTKAGLWERVQNMEKKELAYLNKDIDPSGVTFSGGELQRLMLARALYKDAPVLILDEPTAALDPLAESKLYEKYYDMTKDKTSIFISHRLSSTRFCDRILYMENGRITEEGGHEELMAKQGAYAAMFHTQSQYYEK